MVRTTVVGTYPRVGDTHEEQVLRRSIGRFDKGEIAEAEVRAAEREVVEAVLREQADAGIDVVTDGLVPWYDSQSHLARGLSGIEIDGLVRYFDTNTYYRQPVVRAAVSWSRPILVDEWSFAQAHARAPVKAVLTGPFTLAAMSTCPASPAPEGAVPAPRPGRKRSATRLMPHPSAPAPIAQTSRRRTITPKAFPAITPPRSDRNAAAPANPATSFQFFMTGPDEYIGKASPCPTSAPPDVALTPRALRQTACG